VTAPVSSLIIPNRYGDLVALSAVPNTLALVARGSDRAAAEPRLLMPA